MDSTDRKLFDEALFGIEQELERIANAIQEDEAFIPLRDRFAMAALATMDRDFYVDVHPMAEKAYEIADAMLKEREKPRNQEAV